MKKILFFDMKKAFTVAEILITLGIIGIVAMTIIPVILNEYKNQILETQVNKASSVLNAALRRAAYDNGGSLDGYDLGKNLGEYLKLSKNCFLLTNDYSCWHDTNVVKQRKLDAAGGGFDYPPWLSKTKRSAVTIDGMFIRINNTFNCNIGNVGLMDGCYIRQYSAGYCDEFTVDINGSKGPNIVGEDVKTIFLWSDGYFRGLTRESMTRTRFNVIRPPEGQMHPEWYQPGGKCYDGFAY